MILKRENEYGGKGMTEEKKQQICMWIGQSIRYLELVAEYLKPAIFQ